MSLEWYVIFFFHFSVTKNQSFCSQKKCDCCGRGHGHWLIPADVDSNLWMRKPKCLHPHISDPSTKSVALCVIKSVGVLCKPLTSTILLFIKLLCSDTVSQLSITNTFQFVEIQLQQSAKTRLGRPWITPEKMDWLKSTKHISCTSTSR